MVIYHNCSIRNCSKLRQKLFSWHCFTNFSKTTAPQKVIFYGKLSTIIIFKLCKFNVNPWTLFFFFFLQKVPKSFKDNGQYWILPKTSILKRLVFDIIPIVSSVFNWVMIKAYSTHWNLTSSVYNRVRELVSEYHSN